MSEQQYGVPVMPPIPFMHVLPDSVPIGTVVAFAGQVGYSISSPPLGGDSPITNIEAMGWMFCDGRTLNIVQYPGLYSVIGNIYGGDKGGNTFNIPDYRGQFLRGHWPDRNDDNSGNQTIKTASQENRTKPPGSDGGQNGVGSTQEYALQYHEHNYKYAVADKTSTQGAAAGSPAPKPMLTEDGPQSSQSPQVDVKVSQHETRSTNVFVNFIIKFTYLAQDRDKPGVIHHR